MPELKDLNTLSFSQANTAHFRPVQRLLHIFKKAKEPEFTFHYKVPNAQMQRFATNLCFYTPSYNAQIGYWGLMN